MVKDVSKQLRALSHPLRLQILSILSGATMSAADIARETGTTQANASYHLRRLHEAGQIVLVDEVSIRGGRSRRFTYDAEHVIRQEGGESALGQEDARAVVVRAFAEEMVRRQGQRLDGGESNFTDAELWLEPKVWEAAVKRVQEISLALHRAAQPPRSPGTVRTSTTMAMFVMDPAVRAHPAEWDDSATSPQAAQS